MLKALSTASRLSRYCFQLVPLLSSLFLRSTYVFGFPPHVAKAGSSFLSHHSTTMSSTATDTTQDPYIWLEDVESEESLNVRILLAAWS